jgi:hypothetical protein
MTDAYTDELFPVTPVEAGRVVFPISRLVCDVERFSSDEDEPMAVRGKGGNLHSYFARRAAPIRSNTARAPTHLGSLVLAASLETGTPRE